MIGIAFLCLAVLAVMLLIQIWRCLVVIARNQVAQATLMQRNRARRRDMT